MSKGTIFMLPTTLGSEQTTHVIPSDVAQIAGRIRHFIVEDLKSARRYLRKMDRNFPIDNSIFHILNKNTESGSVRSYLKDAISGNDIAVISEAGCPGVADPGAVVVGIAHELGLRVMPLVGPSSILLTIMGSGFSGQEFTFHGYLPKDRKDRIKALKDFESNVHRTGYTHLFMDTPFRNMNVLDDLLNELQDDTFLCIASNLTLPDESIRSMKVKDWRNHAYDLSKKPTMFALGRIQ